MGIILNFNNYFFIGLIIIFAHLFFLQIYKFETSNKIRCLKIFKSNNILGLLILLNIFIGKV